MYGFRRFVGQTYAVRQMQMSSRTPDRSGTRCHTMCATNAPIAEHELHGLLVEMNKLPGTLCTEASLPLRIPEAATVSSFWQKPDRHEESPMIPYRYQLLLLACLAAGGCPASSMSPSLTSSFCTEEPCPFPFALKTKFQQASASMESSDEREMSRLVGSGTGCDQVDCGGNTSFIGGFPIDELDLSGVHSNSGGFAYIGVKPPRTQLIPRSWNAAKLPPKHTAVGPILSVEDGELVIRTLDGNTLRGREVESWRIQLDHYAPPEVGDFRRHVLRRFQKVLHGDCLNCELTAREQEALEAEATFGSEMDSRKTTAWELEIRHVRKVLHWPETWPECMDVRRQLYAQREPLEVTFEEAKRCFVTTYEFVVRANGDVEGDSAGHPLCKPRRAWRQYPRFGRRFPPQLRVKHDQTYDIYPLEPWWEKTFSALLIADELYDQQTGDVIGLFGEHRARDGMGWFSIGCGGSAIAKMKLLRYDTEPATPWYSTTSDERQATLKMITAKYCPLIAHSPTTTSDTPLLWQNSRKWFSPPLHSTGAVFEATWDQFGAIEMAEMARGAISQQFLDTCRNPTKPLSKDKQRRANWEWMTFVPSGDRADR